MSINDKFKFDDNPEGFYQDIIDNNPMSIQIVDKEGYTLRVNPADLSLSGLTAVSYSCTNPQ